jgi:hypothetical protein
VENILRYQHLGRVRISLLKSTQKTFDVSGFRGSDVAADSIARRNVDELRQRMGDLLSLRDLADALDAIGDQDLIREVFGEPL